MHADLKLIAIAVTVLVAGADAAAAWERTPAPIEFARHTSRPPRSEDAGPTATAVAPVAARVRSAPSMDQPEILYGYGRGASTLSRAPLDLRGSLRVAASAETLPDDAFDDVAPSQTTLDVGARPEQPGTRAAEQETSPEDASPLSPQSPAPAVPAAARPAGAYFIQVGAFANPANAERARTALQDVGSVMIDERQGASATLHRVRLGQWSTRAEAELACDMIVERGFVGAVVSGDR